jgi:very-short-patch-repair endonuclease
MEKLKCQLCGREMLNLSSHIKNKHNITAKEYREKFGENVRLVIINQASLDKAKKTRALFYSKPENRIRASEKSKSGGSVYCRPYWTNKGYSDGEAELIIKDLQKKNNKKNLKKYEGRHSENSPLSMDFYKKRNIPEDIAKEKISSIQSKLSSLSSKYKGKISNIERNSKISRAMKRKIETCGPDEWAKHFGEFNGRSKSEIDFYDYIRNNISESAEANFPIGNYIVDVKIGNRILEFYGDFWHANPRIYSAERVMKITDKTAERVWEKDRIRKDYLEGNGYRVLEIWEYDWNNNKIKCIEEIKRFINE